MTVRGWCRLAIPQVLGAVTGLVVSCVGGVDARASMAPPRGLPAPQAAAWSERLADALQPARSGASAIYDIANNRVIVFGGASGVFLNDTWALSFSGPGGTGTSTWTKLQTIGDTPPPRMWHMAVYDSLAGRMFVHGGYDGRVLDDSYTLDLSTLTWRKFKASTRGLLAPRRYMAAAFTRSDAVTNGVERSMLMFGGSDGDSLQNEFYQLVLSSPDKRREGSWLQYTTVATPRPTKRYGTAVDATQDSIYIFGGRDNTLFTNDVWVLNVATNTWRQEIAPVNFRPNARFGSTITFNAETHTARIYGGSDARKVYADEWVLTRLGTPSAAWVAKDTLLANKDGVTQPEPRSFPAWVKMPNGDLLTVAGMGSSAMLGDAWRLTPANDTLWQPVVKVTNPPSRYGHSLAYDAVRDRVVLYGGLSSFNETLGDVWTYAPGTQTWSKLALQDSLPAPRARAAAAFAQDSVWVFGGWRGAYYRSGGTTIIDNTYGDSMSVFSVATGKWRRVRPDGTRPGGRDGASMIYDGARNRMVVFGGYNGGYLADLWAFDLASESWTRLPDFGGAGRTGHSAILDPSGTKMIVFGGASLTGLLNDVRVFDLANNVWLTAPTVSGTAPTVREWASTFVDGASNSLIVTGGSTNVLEGSAILVPTPASGTYALNLSTYAWSTVTVSGTDPGTRYLSPMVVAGNAAIRFGGTDGGSARSDTWHFSLSASSPAVATSAVTEDGAVMVRWETSQNSPLGYAVVREPLLGASEATVVAKVMAQDLAPAATWAEAADHSASAGSYRYTVVNMANGLRIPAGEVVVPASGANGNTRAIALRAQSPVRGAATLWLVGFESAASATLDTQIYDVSGRHVATVPLTSDGRLTWSGVWNGRDTAGRAVGSGIYLARTAAGGAVHEARVAVVR